jgi:hypothetical protein
MIGSGKRLSCVTRRASCILLESVIIRVATAGGIASEAGYSRFSSNHLLPTDPTP